MNKIVSKELLIDVRDYLRATIKEKSQRLVLASPTSYGNYQVVNKPKRLVPARFSRMAGKNYLRRCKARNERIKIILSLPEDSPLRQALYAKLKQRASKIGWSEVVRRYELPDGSYPTPLFKPEIRNSFTSVKAEAFRRRLRGLKEPEEEIPEYDRRNPELRGFLERHLGPSFAKVLKRSMYEKGMSAPELYTEIGMDRKLFSKIISDKDYHPSKKSVILLALGLKLDENEATELLRTGGYYLSRSCRRDVIIIYCLRNKIYDVYLIDELLEEFSAGSLHRTL